MKSITAPSGSVLLHKLDDWEVRLSPTNKVFLTNITDNLTRWPFLLRGSQVKFEIINGAKANTPPEEIMATLKKVLAAKQKLRRSHSEDFKDTKEQYTFN